jgi:hypothetical protein
MKPINSIPRAFISTLRKRAGSLVFARSSGLPTSKTQTELAPPGIHKAGVLIGEFLFAELVSSLIPMLHDFGKVFSPTRECKRSSGSV